jgi:RHH-type proline utilization regulon transcriptional repressor/proline dehydrogenase/delta 1-pyrroline-5-carboxylate dehydrogenase
MKAMIFINTKNKQNLSLQALNTTYRQDETVCIENLLEQANFAPDALQRIQQTAKNLVIKTRKNRKKQSGLDSFLHQYDLSSEEGIALMCLAEALLRIPDKETIDKLISDKLSAADWAQHLNSNSLFVNAATWSLMLTGKLYAPTLDTQQSLASSLKRFISRTSSAVIRPIVLHGMKIIGNQFVMGTTIDKAIQRAKKSEAEGYCYSYDMLGEAARTAVDADNYFRAYENAITTLGNASQNLNPRLRPSISIKLSALHPRYEFSQRERMLAELSPRLLSLAKQAKMQNIELTVDAEEADRLALSLEIFAEVFGNPDLHGWDGFGLAVQSYQKRAPAVIDWLTNLAKQYQRRIKVRLIKGAYWDSEIKQAQVFGLEGYPVFTRKHSTDVSFLVCAKKLLSEPTCFFPQFGTHNAYSVAAIIEMVGTRNDFEFQCLHGMGQTLYDNIVGKNNYAIPCRIYAPVGSHKDLLGYLVRRLLENGANTSFINRIADENAPIENIIADPVLRVSELTQKPHPRIPLPADIFGTARKNSMGIDLSNSSTQETLKIAMEKAENTASLWQAMPLLGKKINLSGPIKSLVSPSNTATIIGQVNKATVEDVDVALEVAVAANSSWANTPVVERAACLLRAADLLQKNMPALMTLLCREGGKQISDCISEVREAIDFCRYYANQACETLKPQILPGPTGEFNELSLHPRGVIVCISPWNFPLAIFIGQVVAALITGNTVIAKPADQTPLIAAHAVRILHSAGIPTNVLQFLPGQGSTVGAKLIADTRVAGVVFTGSTETAKYIQLALAKREGAIVPFIAETGGQNAMIVDSSALPEQVVIDVMQSAFNSAGQRCSALRVLFIQEDIADHFLTLLQGAMAELTMGDPSLLATDIGPVIDDNALQALEKHVSYLTEKAKLIYRVPFTPTQKGHYFAPCAFELDNLNLLTREVFGPILHIIRYKAKNLDEVLDQIINTGYGLTLGVHSRIEATVKHIQDRMPVGNLYVNRNIIGAVVGVQPFGGERLSGTGPKAGGPHYLFHLCVERALSINTTAAGGNTTLVSLNEDL